MEPSATSHAHNRSAPASEAALLERARELTGRTLADLAAAMQVACPDDMQHDKGWSGQLLEAALGASAGTQPLPDFPDLGIELKTLPIDASGQPLESTYVCTVDLQPASGDWQSSVVWQKLQRVLWLPIMADRCSAPGQRLICNALLWTPTREQAAILQQDWEELMELVSNGELEQISSRQGQYLQMRPKAANASAQTRFSDTDGNLTMTLPRGFYLRASFTHTILQEHFYL